MAKGFRTKKGNITAKGRKQNATYKEGGEGKFPIKDRTSAMSALKLRGHAGPPGSARRMAVISRAAKYAPEAARKAREADARQRKPSKKKRAS